MSASADARVAARTGAVRRARAAAAAAGARVERIPVPFVLGALAVVQWALTAVVAVRVGYSGSLALVVLEVVFLLPLSLVLVHAMAGRLGGRVFAAWSALVWVVLPYAGLLYANRSFRHTYAHDFLPRILGLTPDARTVAMVALLGAAVLALRAIERGALLDVAGSLAGAGIAAALTPRAALVALAPVVALAVGGRLAHATAIAWVLAAALAIVTLAGSPFAHADLGYASDALASLSESFWSGRVLQWLVLAGLVGIFRRRPAVAALLAVWFLAAFLSIETNAVAADRNLLLLHGLVPAWPALALLVAALPLLAPSAGTPRAPSAAETLRHAWRRLHRPAFPQSRVGEGTVATPLWAALTIGCCFGLMAVVGVWNASRYPTLLGYDSTAHLTYADTLIHQGRLPTSLEAGTFYAPPGYYAIAGAATWLGEAFGMQHGYRVAQYLNVIFVLGTAALLLVLARLLFPRRVTVWVGAVGFFAGIPVVSKTAAMFHPEPLNMLLSTAAITFATWILVRRRFDLRALGLLGLVLAAGQLVRVSSLFTAAAVMLALLAALATRSYRNEMSLRKIGIAAAAVLVLTAPWYGRQIVTHRTHPALSVSALTPSDRRVSLPPFWSINADDILNRPLRPYGANRPIPQTYSDIWGDWYGVFAWSAYSEGPWSGALAVMQGQSRIGFLPTLLSIAGVLMLAVLAIRGRIARIPVAPLLLLPVIAVAAYLWRAYSIAAPDGDLLKATYLLTTVPAWALGFGVAVDRLSRRRALGLCLFGVLVALAILELRFTLYGIRDHHAIF
jgi:hypothetical protein